MATDFGSGFAFLKGRPEHALHGNGLKWVSILNSRYEQDFGNTLILDIQHILDYA